MQGYGNRGNVSSVPVTALCGFNTLQQCVLQQNCAWDRPQNTATTNEIVLPASGLTADNEKNVYLQKMKDKKI
jgi:hypothetical protein